MKMATRPSTILTPNKSSSFFSSVKKKLKFRFSSTSHCPMDAIMVSTKEINNLLPAKQIIDLPLELLIKIFSYIDQLTLGTRVSLVCKVWKQLAEDPFLWRKLKFKHVNLISSTKKVPSLSNYSQLKSLTMFDCLINSSFIMTLSSHCLLLEDLSVVSCFELSDTCFGSNHLPCLTDLKCSRLKSLKLQWVEFRGSDSLFFINLGSNSSLLQSFELDDCNLNIECDESFQQMIYRLSDLSKISFKNISVSDVFYISISKAVNLSSLSLEINSINRISDDIFISILTSCQKLKEIDIKFLNLDRNTVQRIFDLCFNTLESVILMGDGLTDAHFIYVERCLRLEKLIIYNTTDLTDNFLRQIKEIRNLRYLELCSCPRITASSFKTIFRTAKFSQINFLLLGECTFLDDSCLRVIADICPYLEHLDTECCNEISDEGVKYAIKKCLKLRVLKLAGFNLQGLFLDELRIGHLPNIEELCFANKCSKSLKKKLITFKKVRPDIKINLTTRYQRFIRPYF